MNIHASRRLATGWLLFWGLLMLAATAGFVALGTWQVHRLHWKHALIRRVNGYLNSAPVAAPGPNRWRRLGPQDEYRRITVTGVLLPRFAFVQANTRLGPGFWAMQPLRRADGTFVLINRGFVDAAHRDPRHWTPVANAPGAQTKPVPVASKPGAGVAAAGTETRVAGLLRLSEPGGGFLRDNDPAAHRWYSRDVPALGRSLGVSPLAPYFVDASAPPSPDHRPASEPDASARAAGGQSGARDGGKASSYRDSIWPVPGMTVVHFRDAHLAYALTWYGLALMTAAALGYGAWLEYRRRHDRRSGNA